MIDRVWNYFRGACSMGAGVLSFVYGEMTPLLITLFVIIVLDYITGVLKAFITKELSSNIGFRGILKKVLILCVVGLAHLIDICVGSGETWRNIAVVFYICNEGLSILENAVACGLPVPKGIKNALKTLEKEGDGNGNKNDV